MELEFIKYLQSQVPGLHPNLRLGIGDDAAILAPNASFSGDYGTVVSVDMLTEGVDFLLPEVEPHLIGRKALGVCLSDLAAMSAIPTAAVIAVALPKTPQKTKVGELDSLELAEQIFSGIQTLADQYHVAIAGGDTNTWDGGLVISVTLMGRTTSHPPLLRSGVEDNDRILVTGELGGSIRRHQFTFTPRVRESLFLNAHYDIHAAIDISDGLAIDLTRILQASQAKRDGTIFRAIINEFSIPYSFDAYHVFAWDRYFNDKKHKSKENRSFLWEYPLYDGEDFELLFTASPETAEKLVRDQPLLFSCDAAIHDIGVVCEVNASYSSHSPLVLLDSSGRIQEIPIRGFLHDSKKIRISPED